jgi:biotin-dependent carboxylase-like uncharacterized protein
MKRLQVLKPGVLALLQDRGRCGQHGLGLTTGGPLDYSAFVWANRLCGNDLNATAIEISLGGLELLSSVNSRIALCGAPMPLWINGEPRALWQTHPLASGDRIAIGHCRHGVRACLAIAGGLQIEPQFGSTATVVREGIGGLRGTALAAGDRLPCREQPAQPLWQVPAAQIPTYTGPVCTLRMIPGYQFAQFADAERQRFLSATYRVSPQSDRMGYRLQGPALTSGITQLYSEGIVLGAVQIPGDGQPIVLLNDRQTIGGYPKLGAVLSCDLDKLAQLQAGAAVQFVAVSAAEGVAIVREQRALLGEKLEVRR